MNNRIASFFLVISPLNHPHYSLDFQEWAVPPLSTDALNRFNILLAKRRQEIWAKDLGPVTNQTAKIVSPGSHF